MTSKYCVRQWTVFCSLFIGYTLFVYVRKSFTFVMPAIIQEDLLQKSQLGLITSSQATAYTISKFVSGILADHLSAKVLLSLGLFSSGLSAILFTAFDSAPQFSVLWFINGLCQGPGWVACAKILKAWYSPKRLGTWWSVLSASMNVAGTIGPLLTSYLTFAYGWRWSMIIPGIVSMCLVVFFQATVVNKPSDVGLQDLKTMEVQSHSAEIPEKDRVTIWDLLTHPFFLMISISYMVIYGVRTGCLDWAQLFLSQEKGQSIHVGSAFTSVQEVGGIVGSIVAGYVSDKFVATKRGSEVISQKGNPRIHVTLLFTIIISNFVYLLMYAVTQNTSKIWISAIGFCMGFGLYGPICLFGVIAMECAPDYLSGTASSLVGLFANVGAVLAGFPLSYIAKQFNWHTAFLVLECLLIAVTFIMFFCRNLEAVVVKHPAKEKVH